MHQTVVRNNLLSSFLESYVMDTPESTRKEIGSSPTSIYDEIRPKHFRPCDDLYKVISSWRPTGLRTDHHKFKINLRMTHLAEEQSTDATTSRPRPPLAAFVGSIGTLEISCAAYFSRRLVARRGEQAEKIDSKARMAFACAQWDILGNFGA